MTAEQLRLFDDTPTVPAWDRSSVQRSIDDLFTFASKYRSSAEYGQLIRFVARFHTYSPFNAMLVHIQMPGEREARPARRWFHEYRRILKAGARPLVILQPKGPVMFVFDVSDTLPIDEGSPLPVAVEHPFAMRSGMIGSELKWTVENARRDGIDIHHQQAGSQHAGQIEVLGESITRLSFLARQKPKPEYVLVPLRYGIVLNADHAPETQYATLVHELAHLYCGHLGTPNEDWWPDRSRLDVRTCEFEAESVSYLVCARLGLDNPSERYLAYYSDQYEAVPEISIDAIVKTAGLVEQMGQGRMKPRKERTA